MQSLALLVYLLGTIVPSLCFRQLPTTEVDTANYGCPTQAAQQTVLDTHDAGILAEVNQNVVPSLVCRLGECESNPATSCQHVLDEGPAATGWYWIRKCDGTSVQVYCAMSNPCGCSGSSAWMRIGFLNMSDPSQQCPPGMGIVASPRSCSRNVFPGNCASSFYSSNFVSYSRICGRVVGYQEGSPDAFRPYFNNRGYTIDDPYFDGVSLTYGFSPRKHVWTFGAGPTDTGNSPFHCPCSTTNYQGVVPPFIGNDWFCEAGAFNNWQRNTIYSDNPLWDGTGCRGPQSTCCTFSNPPWFCKDLPSPTRENIELRACGDSNQDDEDVLVSLFEIYVQ